MTTKVKATAFPANTFAALISAAVVANMTKEEGKPFAVVLASYRDKYTLEVNDNTIVKIAQSDLPIPSGETLAVGTKVFFNEDGSLDKAISEEPIVKAAEAPQPAVRKTGSIERQESRMFDRE